MEYRFWRPTLLRWMKPPSSKSEIIRCTARSVMPTRSATSRSKTIGSSKSSKSTWPWLLRNVQRCSGFAGGRSRPAFFAVAVAEMLAFTRGRVAARRAVCRGTGDRCCAIVQSPFERSPLDGLQHRYPGARDIPQVSSIAEYAASPTAHHLAVAIMTTLLSGYGDRVLLLLARRGCGHPRTPRGRAPHERTRRECDAYGRYRKPTECRGRSRRGIVSHGSGPGWHTSVRMHRGQPCLAVGKPTATWTNVIAVSVHDLRKELEQLGQPTMLHTIRGRGYFLGTDPPERDGHASAP